MRSYSLGTLGAISRMPRASLPASEKGALHAWLRLSAISAAVVLIIAVPNFGSVPVALGKLKIASEWLQTTLTSIGADAYAAARADAMARLAQSKALPAAHLSTP